MKTFVAQALASNWSLTAAVAALRHEHTKPYLLLSKPRLPATRPIPMRLAAVALTVVVVTVSLTEQLPDAKQVAQERRQAEF